MSAQHYHGHIYFTLEQSQRAATVREELMQSLPQVSYVGRLIERSIGPHPLPMFEIHFPAAQLDAIAAMIESKRQGLAVLLHPVQADELEAHTALARWLGPRLELDLAFLRAHQLKP